MKIQNITELRDTLIDALDAVQSDPKKVNQVREVVNASGKIIHTLKMQLEYSMLKGQEPDIPFMGKTSGRPLLPAARLLGK